MAMPAGAVSPVDARLTSTMTLGGVTVVDGGNFDTWNTVWLQATAANQPWYDSISLGGGPCAMFGRLSAAVTQTNFLTNIGLALGIPFSIVIVFRSNGPQAALCEFSSNVTASRGVCVENSSGWTSRINGTGGLQLADNGNGALWGIGNTVQYIILTCDGTTTTLYVNGSTVPFSVSAVAPGTGAFTVQSTIGALHAAVGLPLTGAIGCIYPYTRVLSLSERAQVDADVRASWRITPPNQTLRYQTIGVGDSIMLGAALNANAKIADFLSFMGVAANQLGFRFGTPLNLGVSGAQLPAVLSTWNTTGAPSLVNGPNVAVGEGGINDLGAGATVVQINTRTQALYTAMSSAMSAKAGFGPQFCVVTTLFGPSGNTPNAQLINANTRANFASWGAAGVTMVLSDFGADAVLVAANTNYTQDGTHPTIPGDQRAGTILANALIAAAA